MVGNIALPGMVTGVAGARVASHRAAANVWWLAISDSDIVATGIVHELSPTMRPSEALHALDSTNDGATGSPVTNALVAKLELDVCGAWLTVANGCRERPVAVRRAGWIDLRGHPGHPLDGDGHAPTDDRVGLGPGDALVLRLGPRTEVDSRDDDLIDACLRLAGEPADVVAAEVARLVGGQVAVLGVPDDLGDDPLVRVATATGVPVDAVQTPGYPLGDLQPDLWKQPPRPPRLARLRLSTDRRSVAAVRSLLDRLLGSWRLTARVNPDDVKLVATELAANAIVHGKEPETVTVRFLGDVVRIEVADRSPLPPMPTDAGPDALGGRGMHLVETLGAAWGSEQTAAGKRVWCDLEVADAERA